MPCCATIVAKNREWAYGCVARRCGVGSEVASAAGRRADRRGPVVTRMRGRGSYGDGWMERKWDINLLSLPGPKPPYMYAHRHARRLQPGQFRSRTTKETARYIKRSSPVDRRTASQSQKGRGRSHFRSSQLPTDKQSGIKRPTPQRTTKAHSHHVAPGY